MSAPAYSQTTDREYPSWEALVAAEANGWLATASFHNTRNDKLWSWSHGPVDTKAEAVKVAARLRRELRKQCGDYSHIKFSVSPRPAWKTAAQLKEATT